MDSLGINCDGQLIVTGGFVKLELSKSVMGEFMKAELTKGVTGGFV